MEPNKKKKIIELGILPEEEYSGVSAIALVEEPAIAVDFLHFKKEQLAGVKVSFDYHETLNTERGKELAKKELVDGADVYVISAGQDKEEFMPLAKELGIDPSKVYATGSNSAKIEKIKELGIEKHYDNNQDVIDELGEVGMKFDINTNGLEPYVNPGIKKKPELIAIANDDFTKEEFEALSEFEKQVVIKAINSGIDFEECNYIAFASQAIKDLSNEIRSNITTDTSRLKPAEYEIRYKYAKNGGGGGAERGFCKAMMYMGRLYTKEEINSMSDSGVNGQFAERGSSTYDIFEFRGGSYCKHYWKAYMYYKPYDDSRQIVTEAPGFDGPRDYVPRLNFALQFADEEQRIVVGPCMIPGLDILRLDEAGQPYWVNFSEETIKEIAMKYMKEARTNEINQDHIEDKTAGTYVFESWLIEDPKTDKANTVYGFDLPKGTWVCKMKVEDPAVWQRVKNGELKGFSVEGAFADMEEIQAQRDYQKIKNILKG
jgi:hypothetical protein